MVIQFVDLNIIIIIITIFSIEEELSSMGEETDHVFG